MLIKKKHVVKQWKHFTFSFDILSSQKWVSTTQSNGNMQ